MWNERDAAEFGSCCTTRGGAEIIKVQFCAYCPTQGKGAVSRALRCEQIEWLLPDNLSNRALGQGCLWSERGEREQN